MMVVESVKGRWLQGPSYSTYYSSNNNQNAFFFLSKKYKMARSNEPQRSFFL
jgi:hypothetical protein